MVRWSEKGGVRGGGGEKRGKGGREALSERE